MGSPDAERDRIGLAYRSYAGSARKRRLWSAENLGNIAIRTELTETAFAIAGGELASARRILDVGCGTGWWLAQLSRDPRVVAELEGVEMLPERVSAASRRLPDAQISVADARDLPFADSSFDVVTLFTVLSSIGSGRERALSEARRVLAPDGALMIWEPRMPNPLNRNAALINRDMLRQGLRGAAVEARTTTVLPSVARRLGRFTGRLYPLLTAMPFLRTHRFICARGAGRRGAGR